MNKEKKVLESILSNLSGKISKTDYSWLANIEAISLNDKELLLAIDNKYMKDKIEKEYINLIEEEITAIGLDAKVKFMLKEKTFKHEEKEELKQENKFSCDAPNPRYLFKNFIVGKSNEFAHAAAEAVANSPGKVYNPLFIYGLVGTGKSHLMHAIGNKFLQDNPKALVHYCSSEQFTNDLINSLKRDRMAQFREKYRKLDLLLIDDIQFIAGKESTQEEFFYTFNSLHQYSRQIVISSDRPPQEIKNIEERLTSRFAWGLIADIKAPDYETRVAILKNKAEEESLDIPEDAISYIAEVITSNVRELEGALNRVVAKASLFNRTIDHQLIQEVFKGFVEDRAKKVTKTKIMKIISDFYHISLQEMCSTKRKKEIAKARQVSMYFMRNILNMPYSSIGEAFGGKDHTTVLHSVNKIDSEIAYDKALSYEIDELRQIILK